MIHFYEEWSRLGARSVMVYDKDEKRSKARKHEIEVAGTKYRLARYVIYYSMQIPFWLLF
jgi:hypothetical protein